MPEQVRTFLTVYLAKKSVGNAQNQEVYYKTVDLHRNSTDSYRIKLTINITAKNNDEVACLADWDSEKCT